MKQGTKQSQISMLLQSVGEALKNPRMSSLVQCAGMGALAFVVMVLIVRFSLATPLFGTAGVMVALVVGGAAGALVRYYFVRKEQESEDVTTSNEATESATDLSDPPFELTAGVATGPDGQDFEEAPPLAIQAIEREHAAMAEDAPPEAEASDMPRQLELWPSVRESHDTAVARVEEPQDLIELAGQQPTSHAPCSTPLEAQLFAWIMKSAPVFCVAINERDEIVMANNFTAESLGYAVGDIMGLHFTEHFVPPRLRREAWTDLLTPGGESNDAFSIESCLLAKDGRQIPVAWQGTVFFDAGDIPLYCLLMGFDISDRVSLEEELQKNRWEFQHLYADALRTADRFRSVLDSSVEASVLYDLHGQALYANPAFTRVFGWILEDLKNPEILFVPAAQSEVEKPLLDELLAKGVPCQNLDTKRQAKDGRIVSARMTASRVCDSAGLCTGMLVTLRELVERNKAVKESLMPVSTPPKRQVNAKEIAKDIRSGATDLFLMEKYKLTAKGLSSLFQKLVQAKVVKASEIVRRSAAYDETVAIEVSRVVPRVKPKPQPEGKKLDQVSPPPLRSVKTEVQDLDKYGLTEDNLEDLVKGLLPPVVKSVTHEAQPSPVSTQELEDAIARRTMPRHYMVVSVPIYESGNLLCEGTIIDISEQGMRIQGLDVTKGETKSLLIQGDQFHDVFPFIFDAVCRWTTTDTSTGECVAGFQITTISQKSIEELRKLISALSIGS